MQNEKKFDFNFPLWVSVPDLSEFNGASSITTDLHIFVWIIR
jgi:hypothetical protein